MDAERGKQRCSCERQPGEETPTWSLKTVPVPAGGPGGNTALRVATVSSQKTAWSLDSCLQTLSEKEEPTRETSLCHYRRLWVANPQVQPLASWTPRGSWRMVNLLALVHWCPGTAWQQGSHEHVEEHKVSQWV